MTDQLNRVHFGDCRDSMRAMAAAGVTVQMCVTSPPYFGLRDYGHEGQIGLEETPEQYIAAMVEVFRCVRDLLADDGTLWVNIGDSYAVGTGAISGCKQKDLIGIPWMLAFALRADGWYLRQDIIWHKPNPMPESVTDRCTKAHEYVFLLSKGPSYFYDAEAVKEPVAASTVARLAQPNLAEQIGSDRVPGKTNGNMKAVGNSETRNRRSVWTIATRPYKGAHFAVFPSALVEPCILAGSRPAGKRCDCNQIIRTPTGTVETPDPSREVGRAGMSRQRGQNEGIRPITRREQRHHALEMKNSPHQDAIAVRCGPAFAHYVRTDDSGARPLPEVLRQEFIGAGWITEASPCDCPDQPADIVLDPFMGSGTTAAVAVEHGRQFLGCELNVEYGPLQSERIAAARADVAEIAENLARAAAQFDMFASEAA